MQSEKIYKITVNSIRLILLITFLLSIIYYSWFNLVMSCLTFILTFAPTWFEKKYKIEIPLDFEIIIISFIFASLFLGEIHNFYLRFWWWDILLHTISAFTAAFIGFLILLILFKTNTIKSRPIWIAVYSFCFAITIGVIWEIFEFFMDQTFGFNMQKSGLHDTMWDLISNCFGALLASTTGYIYLKGSQRSVIGGLINSFITSNPKIKFVSIKNATKNKRHN